MMLQERGMQEILITIGVICYNNERYLEECLSSVVAQEGDDVEIIVVDDASADASFAICQRFAQRDARMRVIRHAVNQKASGARNTILKHARGTWITFVDGDDLLTEHAIRIMREHTDTPAQHVMFHYDKLVDGAVVPYAPQFQAELLRSEEDLLKFRCRIFHGYYDRFQNLQSWTPWAKLWNRSFLLEHGCQYDPSVLKGQDAVLNFLCAHYYSCVELVPASVYVYRLNEGSISVRFQEDAQRKVTSMLHGHRRNIERFGETANTQIMHSYYQLCLYSFKEAMTLSIYHPACGWSRAERMAWLDEFCRYDWVQEMTAYFMGRSDLAKKDRLLITLLHRSALGTLDCLYRAKNALKNHTPPRI